MVTRLEDGIIERVIKARQEAKLERPDVAKALSLETNSYANYERRRSPFTVEQLFQISRFLHVPVEELLGLSLPKDISQEDRRLLFRIKQLPTGKRMSLMAMLVALEQTDNLSE